MNKNKGDIIDINSETSLTSLGGKGYQLTRLAKSFNVPPFFIITFENQNELSVPNNQKDIIRQCENYNFDMIAVRSSASVEDSENASFAGMFKTVFVHSRDVISAIRQVLESANNERVSKYCISRGFEIQNIHMNVIVQKLIKSRVSGVTFTRNGNNSEQLIVEACYGLGEALVSGKITPDSYFINRSSLEIIKTSIGYQKDELTLTSDNSCHLAYKNIPFHKRTAKKLTINEIKKVVEVSLHIEQYLNFDASDIEWAFEDETFFILQARPLIIINEIISTEN